MLRALLLLAPVLAQAQIRFTEVSEAAGVQPLQHVLRPRGQCFLYEGRHCEPERMSGGVAVGDYDGDGWPDLYFTRLDGEDTLLRNQGDGTFADTTAAAGLDVELQSNGALWVDIDNDRDLDLYLTTIGEDRYHLFVNEDGVFVEQALDRGAAVASPAVHIGFGVAAGDYDRDGWVDLFVTEWRIDASAESPPHTRLLRNRGGVAPGHFEDLTEALDIALPPVRGGGSYGFAPAFSDLDDDGWPDLAIAADFGSSRLFWNNGDGTFTDGTEAAGVGTDEHGMGSTIGDFDGDGRLDWFVTSIFDPVGCEAVNCNWLGTGNRLYRNLGERRFEDATDRGVRDGRWGWGAAFIDADNDGDRDLVMTNGVQFPGFVYDDRFNADPMRFWRNDDGDFVEVAEAAGLTDSGSGKGLALVDYDRDGDLDIVVVRTGDTPRLYRNDSVGGRSLVVSAAGTRSNRFGLGARVTVESDRVQVAEIGTVSHFLGQGQAAAHFGLGDATSAAVTVRWPSGVEQRYPCVVAGRLHVEEPAIGDVFVFPPAAAEVCDGLDQDCDGVLDEGLPDAACGVGRCAHAVPSCVDGAPGPCDALADAVDEVCNGEDDDCDGVTDELPEAPCEVGSGACRAAGLTRCERGALRCDAVPEAPGIEACNGVDDDCDGALDEAIPGQACGVGACARDLRCEAGAFATCDPLLGASVETCDGVDDDCDGATDEGLPAVTCGVGICARTLPGCTAGAVTVCDPSAGARAERCDGFDDDCDGAVDESWPELGGACDGPDVDACADGTYVCAGGGVRCEDLGGGTPEVCGGGDEDCDGRTDEGCDGDAEARPDVDAGPDAEPDAAAGARESAGCQSAPGVAGWWLLLAIRRRSRAGPRPSRRSSGRCCCRCR